MSRDFLSNFERTDKPKPQAVAEDDSLTAKSDDTEYGHGEYPQSLFFVWPDGKIQFIDYSRLASGSFDPDQSLIKLNFGEVSVELTGVRLQPLIHSIGLHHRKTIHCDDERYNDLGDNDGPIVNEISITQNT